MSMPTHWVATFYGEGTLDDDGRPAVKVLHTPAEVGSFIGVGVEHMGFGPDMVVDQILAADGGDYNVTGELDLSGPIRLVPLPDTPFWQHPANPSVVIEPQYSESRAEVDSLLTEDEKAWLQELQG